VNDESEPIDVGGLLTIDVDSELRKLSSAQFQGPWQLPAELVRRALARGSHHIQVETGRHRVVVHALGVAIGEEQLRATAMLLDGRQPNEVRHKALTRLEAEGELTLLGLFSLHCRRIELSTHAPTGGVRLIYERGSPPRLEAARKEASLRCEVSLRAPSLDRRQVTQWLQNVARFARGNITLDGKPIACGFDDVIVHTDLRAPLVGRIAIPRDSESAHVWLLEHGLVSAHITVPDAPAFEAAVELGSDAIDLSAARLREAVTPHLKELVDQATSLLVSLGRSFQTRAFPEETRAQAARLVLQAAHKRLRFEEVVALPLFRAVDPAGYRLIDLLGLRASASRDATGAFLIAALYPNQRTDRFALGAGPVLVADATERTRIAELMQVRFRPPESRDSRGSMQATLRRLADSARYQLRSFIAWARYPIRARPVPEPQLDATERNFVDLMRHELVGTIADVVLCHGAGPVRRSRGPLGVLQLPRKNPDVQAAISAVTTDPAWVYPAALALMDGLSLPPVSTRARWLERPRPSRATRT